ncbi:MAG TPA: TIM-barrel domain-containing protein [Planosporangium sp.]|jgi:alpha-D-xyloside xylohydrolase|nr:TIM-barrel domain-containing protein [Planosporangium sp.]
MPVRRLRWWLAAGLTLAVTAAGLTVSTPPATAAGGDHDLGWRVERAPFRLSFRADDRQLVGQAPGPAAGPGARMSYQLSDGGTHRLTDLLSSRATGTGAEYTVATDEAARTASVTVTRTPRGLRVAWSLQPATGVVAVYEALTGTDSEHFLGGGANSIFVDLRHRVLLNKALFAGASVLGSCNKNGAPSPLFISSRGYGVFPDTTAVGRLAFPNAVEDVSHCVPPTPPLCPVLLGQPDRTQLCFKANTLAYEVYAGSPEKVATAYAAKAGRPTLPPVRQFALTQWRDTTTGQAQVLDDVARMRRMGLPISTVWIDNPWEISSNPGGPPSGGSACNGTLRFDPYQFPDPKAMVDQLHAQGVHLGIWVSPFVRPIAAGRPCPDAGYPPGSFVDTGRTDRQDIDLTVPAARAHFESKLESLFRLGIDMVKGDRGEETDFETATFGDGTSGTLTQNPYPVLYAESVAKMLRTVHGDDYTMLFRAGYTGQPSVLNGFWEADADMTFDGLRLSLRRGLNSWISGHPVWGSDTGGYHPTGSGPTPTPTLFTRWSQLSAVSPVFEFGGPTLNSTPWLYDDATIARFTSAVTLHYELFPYLYRLAQQAARTGVPITRPLGFAYPDDEAAWQADQELLVGADLLAAPVTADRAEADGAAGLPTPVDVYLPAGNWVDLYTGEVVAGGRHVTRQSTLDDFPLYLRQGAAIGFNARTPDVWSQSWGTADLDRRDRAGWLYSPGSGPTVADSPFGGRFTATATARDIRISLRGAPAQTQVTIGATAKAVYLDGRPVPAATSLDALRSADSGWMVAPGPFGGLVVKLHPWRGAAGIRVVTG